MHEAYRDPLDSMPDIAEAVNRFDSESAQNRALEALLRAFYGRSPREADVDNDVSFGGPPDDRAGSGHGGPVDAARGLDDARGHLSQWEVDLIRSLPEEDAVASASRDQQAVWGVIKLRELNKEATSETVHDIINERLGIGPEDKGNLSYRLGNLTPRHVRREKRSEGQGFAYFPTRHSRETFGDAD